MIPASGGLIIAVNWSMSNMPRFETENVAPVYSLGCSRRLRARSASSLASRPARPLHVHFGRQEEMRNGAQRRGQPFGDRLTDLGERNVIVRGSSALGKRETGNGKRCCGRCGRPG